MAGGVAGKSHNLYVVALAKMKDAEKAIHQLQQYGAPASDPRHTNTDTAITAAIAALTALT